MKKRSKQAKKWKVCGKLLGGWNNTGLCGHHYRIKYARKRRKIRKEKHLCIQCGKKVKLITKHYAYDLKPPITFYPLRCAVCLEKERNRLRKTKKKRNKKLRENYQKNKEKIRLRNQRPEIKAHHKAYQKTYDQKPEVKIRNKEYKRTRRQKLKELKKKQKTELVTTT